MQGLLVEPCAAALGAHGAREELSRPLLYLGRGIVGLLQLNVFQQPVEGGEVVRRTHRCGLNIEPLIGTIHNLIDSLLGHILQWGLQRCAIFFADSGNLPEDERVLVFSYRRDATIVD